MNKKIRQLAFGLMACFLLLFGAMNYWQVARESEINAMADNTRAIRRAFGSPRGEILSYDGRVVARSDATAAESTFPYQRVYPEGELFANVTGYYTFPFGSTLVERTMDDVLRGDTARQRIGNLEDIVSRGDGTGSVRLTIDYELQRLADQLLEGRDGSVVVIDTRTGAVRAMYSEPSYDPNLVATLDFDAAGLALERFVEAEGNPLLANAYQDRFMPGSTFKLLTTSIALEAGLISMESSWPVETEWVPPQTDNPIQNYGGEDCGGTLLEVFSRSCNIPFARIAVETLGVDAFRTGTEAWGVGERVPIDLPRPAASTIGDTDDLEQNLPLLAMRGFGQNEDQMVPLHMALIAGAIANGGAMLEPYVVDATLDSDGRALTVTEGGQQWRRPISEQTAAEMNTLMQAVATRGTASCCIALDGGIPVAAKTGTGQLNNPGEPERSNAWIVAFAPADQPRYAVAVALLGTSAEVSASTGGRLAGPIAREMLNAAFREEGGWPS